MRSFDDDIFDQPDGFPGLDGAVLEVPVDSTAGRLGGDFTGERLPYLKPRISTGRFTSCRSAKGSICFKTFSEAEMNLKTQG